MGPFIPLALAAGALFLLAKSKTHPNSGIRPAIGPVNTIKGRSGIQWEVQMVEAPSKPLSDGGSSVMQVILNPATPDIAKHMVIEYMQTGAGSPPKRVLVRKGPAVPGLVQAAIADFGVTGPAAEAAAQGKA